MRAVIQRVSQASVTADTQVDAQLVASIGPGLLVYLGVSKLDNEADAAYLARKILNMRVFPGSNAPLDFNVKQAGASLLIVSQFTLYGDVRRGNRPSFDSAAPAAEARSLYEHFVGCCRHSGVNVQTGIFQANMHIQSLNEGPLTIFIDSNKQF